LAFSLFILLFLLPGAVFAQNYSNLHTRRVAAADTIRIDTLSVVPGSLQVFDHNGNIIPDSCFTTDQVNALLIRKPACSLSDSITLIYRTFPILFSKSYFHKSYRFSRIDPTKPIPGYDLKLESRSSGSLPAGQLHTSGSLSRGLNMGNNRDASLTSNLNIQLNGPLNRDFQIEASLSDANLPVQPDGTTQQIQAFDRVFLRIYNPRHELIGGDFELTSHRSHFFKMCKKVQGLQYNYTSTNASSKVADHLSLSSALALVKGKYARNKITAIEGNQGPYLLKGTDGAQYIQVIAGSERVYIDGVLLRRGEDNDYLIDYNTAEIRFTPHNLITREKRIVVEFEYTERSYTRFVLHQKTEWKTDRSDWYLHLYSESDAKNQPLLQNLTDQQKILLSSIGDQTNRAIYPNIRESAFSANRVFYKMIDTLVNGIRYDSVLVQSFNPDSAHYEAGFSFVGRNHGNYKQVASSANGRVFQWIAPVNGLLQGSYEPVTRLVTPKSKQILVIGGHQQLTPAMSLTTEWSVSRNDPNTFSKLDAHDNWGMGILTRVERSDTLWPGYHLHTWVRHRYTGSRYDPLERFRKVEFERDWNLITPVTGQTENLLEGGLSFTGPDSLHAGYQATYLNQWQNYRGWRQQTSGHLKRAGHTLDWNGSYLLSHDPVMTAGFFRHQIQYRHTWKKLRLLVSENHEDNQQRAVQTDSLRLSSFAFQEYRVQAGHPSPKENSWMIRGKYRVDRIPLKNKLSTESRAWEIENWINLAKSPEQQLKFGFHLRYLSPADRNSEDTIRGFSATGRIDGTLRLWKGAVVSQTYLELGSGMDRTMEYSYLEVAPGQGLYTWNDYNQNGIPELDEFDPAHFSDQARYIRIFRPGNSYLPTLLNRFSQMLIIRPRKGIAKHFSSRLAYRVEKKSPRSDYLLALNPLWGDPGNSALISMNGQIRHILSFNKNHPVYGIDLISLKQSSKILMVNGSDGKNSWSHTLNLRWHPVTPLLLMTRLETGMRRFQSEYFKIKNYRIRYNKSRIEAEYQMGDRLRSNLNWTLQAEHNNLADEKLTSSRIEMSLTRQIPKKGKIELSLQHIWMHFEGSLNSPAAYLMLKGLQPGHNGIARATVSYRLAKNLRMDLIYEGRIAAGIRPVHNGQIQIRAIF